MRDWFNLIPSNPRFPPSIVPDKEDSRGYSSAGAPRGAHFLGLDVNAAIPGSCQAAFAQSW